MNSKDYKPIVCGDYDMLEIACMDQYRLEIWLEDSAVVGKATSLNVRKPAEYLVVELEDGGHSEIRIDRIRRIVVLSRPSRFTEFVFQT